MKKSLNLKGNICQCKLEGEYKEHTHEYRVDNDVGYYYEKDTIKYYEGKGVISEAGKKYFFTFHKEASDNVNSLEKTIFNFKEFSTDLLGPRLVDIVLMSMLAEISKSDDIIPDITLPEINSDRLIECGIFPDKSGQFYIQFPIQDYSKGGSSG